MGIVLHSCYPVSKPCMHKVYWCMYKHKQQASPRVDSYWFESSAWCSANTQPRCSSSPQDWAINSFPGLGWDLCVHAHTYIGVKTTCIQKYKRQQHECRTLHNIQIAITYPSQSQWAWRLCNRKDILGALISKNYMAVSMYLKLLEKE